MFKMRDQLYVNLNVPHAGNLGCSINAVEDFAGETALHKFPIHGVCSQVRDIDHGKPREPLAKNASPGNSIPTQKGNPIIFFFIISCSPYLMEPPDLSVNLLNGSAFLLDHFFVLHLNRL
ncbi:MAG TPA: hypothetical protein VLA58_03765, partial [Chitinophagaceae bacterium]|nr:hypothetical protein [Chitinophagaceae bacterium]